MLASDDRGRGENRPRQKAPPRGRQQLWASAGLVLAGLISLRTLWRVDLGTIAATLDEARSPRRVCFGAWAGDARRSTLLTDVGSAVVAASQALASCEYCPKAP